MAWTPKRSFEEIRMLVGDLQKQRSPVIDKMLEIQRHYNADIVIPLPDVKDEPRMPNLTPQMMTDVIDNLSIRAATVTPMVFSPSIDPYKDRGKGSKQYAIDRQRILNATYHFSNWRLARRRSLRFTNAYETTSIWVEPNFQLGMPTLRLRNPLETYPEPRSAENFEPSEYSAFITRYSGDYLRARFPMVRAEQGGVISDRSTTQLWDVFEWIDSDQIRYGVMGPVYLEGDHVGERVTEKFGGPFMPITDPVENKSGRCLVFTPQAVTLHTIGNRLNRLIEVINWQNKLMALDILAQEKAVFPDMYVIGSRTGAQPQLVSGPWQDGRTGQMNLISDAESVGVLNQTPDQRTSQMYDRLERNFRVSSGAAPQMSGETHGAALRTGRALSTMAEISVDPRIQELHEIDETWMPHVNQAILASYKGWWGNKKYTVFSGWPGDTGQLEFVPNTCIETLDNTVEYAIPGADMTQLTQILGSMLGADAIATETFQRLHPMIRDPYGEIKKIEAEKLDRMTLGGLEQQVISGQLPMSVFARIKQTYDESDISLTDAIVQVDDEIREEQLAAQEAAMQQQQPPMDLNAMMGLAAGPAAAAPGMGPPPAPPGPPSAGPVGDMRALLQGANPMAGAAPGPPGAY